MITRDNRFLFIYYLLVFLGLIPAQLPVDGRKEVGACSLPSHTAPLIAHKQDGCVLSGLEASKSDASLQYPADIRQIMHIPGDSYDNKASNTMQMVPDGEDSRLSSGYFLPPYSVDQNYMNYPYEQDYTAPYHRGTPEIIPESVMQHGGNQDLFSPHIYHDMPKEYYYYPSSWPEYVPEMPREVYNMESPTRQELIRFPVKHVEKKQVQQSKAQEPVRSTIIIGDDRQNSTQVTIPTGDNSYIMSPLVHQGNSDIKSAQVAMHPENYTPQPSQADVPFISPDGSEFSFKPIPQQYTSPSHEKGVEQSIVVPHNEPSSVVHQKSTVEGESVRESLKVEPIVHSHTTDVSSIAPAQTTHVAVNSPLHILCRQAHTLNIPIKDFKYAIEVTFSSLPLAMQREYSRIPGMFILESAHGLCGLGRKNGNVLQILCNTEICTMLDALGMTYKKQILARAEQKQLVCQNTKQMNEKINTPMLQQVSKVNDVCPESYQLKHAEVKQIKQPQKSVRSQITVANDQNSAYVIVSPEKNKSGKVVQQSLKPKIKRVKTNKNTIMSKSQKVYAQQVQKEIQAQDHDVLINQSKKQTTSSAKKVINKPVDMVMNAKTISPIKMQESSSSDVVHTDYVEQSTVIPNEIVIKRQTPRNESHIKVEKSTNVLSTEREPTDTLMSEKTPLSVNTQNNNAMTTQSSMVKIPAHLEYAVEVALSELPAEVRRNCPKRFIYEDPRGVCMMGRKYGSVLQMLCNQKMCTIFEALRVPYKKRTLTTEDKKQLTLLHGTVIQDTTTVSKDNTSGVLQSLIPNTMSSAQFDGQVQKILGWNKSGIHKQNQKIESIKYFMPRVPRMQQAFVPRISQQSNTIMPSRFNMTAHSIQYRQRTLRDLGMLLRRLPR